MNCWTACINRINVSIFIEKKCKNTCGLIAEIFNLVRILCKMIARPSKYALIIDGVSFFWQHKPELLTRKDVQSNSTIDRISYQTSLKEISD